MSDKIYPWKRFWFPLGTELDLDENGFLYDPDGEYSRYNPNAITLAGAM